MMMHSIVRKIDVFEIEIKDLSGSFQFKLEVSKVEVKRSYHFRIQTKKQF